MKVIRETWLWIIVVALIVSIGIFFWGADFRGVEDEIAIRVNEETVTMSEFENIKEQTEKGMVLRGMNPTDEEVEEETRRAVIEELLFLSYVKEKNLDVTEKEIDDFYELLLSQEEAMETKEDFYRAWEGEGITREDIKEQVLFAIKYEKLFNKYTKEAQVSAEEMRKAYDDYISWMKETGEPGEEIEVISFEEMEEELKEFALHEKVAKRIDLELSEFREKSIIEEF